jgi:ArsR family transcriptional regulator, arsenate/arsenite/antimonite-responsive transcriptional repressor / arsenate reductase (thioredoxin)
VHAPETLHLLGHDVRWELASRLSWSDLRVGELTAATGLAQNLVSYHLRLLREAGVVRERRSSADARDVYYSLDRRGLTAGLQRALAAITPGAARQAARASKHSPAFGSQASVLFLCTGNSARSQIAEVMLRRLARRHILVHSAGTHPVGVHPQVHKVLAARGMPSSNLRSKPLAELADRSFDYVITLCDVARSEPIELIGRPRRAHWSIPDPVTARGGGNAVVRAFDQTASEIEMRVTDFYGDLLARGSAA